MAIGSTSIGSLIVNLVANTKQFQSRMKGATASMQRFSASAMRVGSVLTAAAGIPLAAATAEAARFEYQMAKVGTMLGKHADTWMPEFRDGISRTAMEYGQSTKTLTSAAYDWISAQRPIPETLEATAAASKAAWAGFTETETAMSALITTATAFGDEIENITDASDFLFSVVKRGRLTYEELTQNIGDVAPVAAAAGLSLEETGAALAMITRGMPNVARATTSLRNIISNFMKSTNEAQRVAEEYGISLNATTLETEGLFSVLQKLAKLPRDVITKIFPRRRALRGLWVMLNNIRESGTDLEAMYNRRARRGRHSRRSKIPPHSSFQRYGKASRNWPVKLANQCCQS